jgi:hypothetical protein
MPLRPGRGREKEIDDMSDILLSSPVVWLYVLYVTGLVIAFVVDWTNSSGPKGDPRRSRPEEGVHKPWSSRDWYPPAGMPW